MKYDYTDETEKYSGLMQDVIRQKEDLEQLLNSDIKIGFVESTEKKKSRGKFVFADTRKVIGVYKLFCPYDFVITFYMPHIAMLNSFQLIILMWHELKHCGVDEHGEAYIIPHDIEDFEIILNEHGLNWTE